MNGEYQEFLARFRERTAVQFAEFEKAVDKARTRASQAAQALEASKAAEAAKAEEPGHGVSTPTEGAVAAQGYPRPRHARRMGGTGPVQSILRRG
ncbi:hypothetical protein [Corynebacterium pacaense]|uniref:hypothetical protein n=1 Tax=Corynebacterium pacaense TaxID=1816684 RepID=UPI0009BAF7DA|nr:hypothetical protein [Corynebacterium pacaense]